MSTEDYVKNKMGEKYQVLLKYLNRLLVNMGNNPIQDVRDFKNIKKNDLLTEENDKVFEDMKEEIYRYYGKYNLRYDQKNTIKNYMLTLLKTMCGELFLNFYSKTIRKKVDNKTVAYIMYDITLPD